MPLSESHQCRGTFYIHVVNCHQVKAYVEQCRLPGKHLASDLNVKVELSCVRFTLDIQSTLNCM